MMDRRAFIAVVGGSILAAPLAAGAQQAGKVYRIGLLGLSSRSDITGLEALRQGLRDLGYEEGKNLVIEYRWAEGKYDRLPGFADELVRRKVDVLVTYGTPGARAAKRATTTIPVVVAIMGDAVAMGIVPSLARPGGNITGSQFHFPEIMGKRVEMLKEAIPRLARIAILFNPANPSLPPALKVMEETARSLGIELQLIEVPNPQDFVGAFAVMAQRRSEGFVVADDPMLRSHGRAIAELAAKRRLPSVGEREYAGDGGLLAYAVNRPEVWRQAAVFIDKILKGAKPADLPFEQTTKFELVINLKTAKALGLTIPQTLLLRADQVIE
jgi:putative tryptophan/tyrosine transport system substrate-binding protein